MSLPSSSTNPDDLYQYAQDLKETGNSLFNRGSYQEALNHFMNSLHQLETAGLSMDVDLSAIRVPLSKWPCGKRLEVEKQLEMMTLCITLHLNIAASAIKMGMFDLAIFHCNKALDFKGMDHCPGMYIRAVYSKGQGFAGKGNYISARNALLHAYTIQPQNELIRQELKDIEDKITQEKLRQATLPREEKNASVSAELLMSGAFGGKPYYSPANIFHKINKRSILGISKSSYQISMGQQYVPTNTVMPETIDSYIARTYSGQYSLDGSLFYTCCQDWKLRIYDTSQEGKFKQKHSISAIEGRWTITDSMLTRDNRFLIYSSITPTVHIVNLGGGEDKVHQEILDFNCQSQFDFFGIWSLRFSGDSREIVAGTSDNSIYVYDIETKTIIHRLYAHNDDVNAVAFANDDFNSNIVLSGSDDSMIYIWDRRSFSSDYKPERECVGHMEGLTYLSPKGDGRYILSNSKDQTMKLWDMRKTANFNSTPRVPRRYRWDYRRGAAYPGDVQTDVHPHDMSLVTMVGHQVLSTLIRCYFSPKFSTGQRYCITGSQDGKVYIYSLDATPVSVIPVTNTVVRDVAWHPQFQQITATCWDGKVCNFNYDGQNVVSKKRKQELKQ